MRSFGRALRGLVVVGAAACGVVPAHSAVAEPRDALHRGAGARGACCARSSTSRRSRAQPQATTSLLDRVRATGRRLRGHRRGCFPRSGYSDNALWQGARAGRRRVLAVRRGARPRDGAAAVRWR